MQNLLLVAALGVLLANPASAVTIDWVPVGNTGNAADTPSTNCYAASCGFVAYGYLISKYEVTNTQYAEFLNAKAKSDPLFLYETLMGSDATFGGITRTGSSGSYTYAAKAGFENKPVTYVTFYDSLRFSNWLNNGQGSGDTETGAYTLLGGTTTPSNGSTVTRNGGANIVLTSENEWYKAAFHSPGGVYFEYATGTDTVIGCVAPGSDTGNSANCSGVVGAPTDVGAYGLSDSPYGTFDQAGNLWEWNEQIVSGVNDLYRGLRGGAESHNILNLPASAKTSAQPEVAGHNFGFRVVSLVPEPGTGLLVMTGVLGLAASRRQRAN